MAAVSNGLSASQRIDRWQPAGRPPPIRMCEGSAKARSSLPAQGAIRSSSQGRRPWSPGAHAASPNGATVPFAVRTTNGMAGPSALDSGTGQITRGVAPGWANAWPVGPEEGHLRDSGVGEPAAGEVHPKGTLGARTSCGQATPVESKATQPGLPRWGLPVCLGTKGSQERDSRCQNLFRLRRPVAQSGIRGHPAC